MSPKPVYWKPRYPTRRMRERAFIKQQIEHDRRLERMPHEPGLWTRIHAWLSR
jgi:hypothetical protein